jgi:hypothetical protein
VKNNEQIYRTGKDTMDPEDHAGPHSVACAATVDATGQRKGRIEAVGDSDFARTLF